MKRAQDFIVEIPVLKPSDRMTKARQILRDDRFREIYVVDAKKGLLGCIDITDGLRVTATKSDVTVEGFVRDAPAASPADTVELVAGMMRQYHTDSAAVVNGKRQVTGGVLLADIFPVIISKNELHGPVSKYMTMKVISAQPSDNIQKVYTLIMDSGFAAFPVVEKKKLAGVISRRDLISHTRARSAIAQRSNARVGDLMTRDVVVVSSGEPVSTAAELLVMHDVSLLPVVDRDQLVGVINRHDVLAALA
ncbi:CBS domain-containing protein [Methanoregula sp.]|uniref:CBS domain-containing protein n=1 Tax=Methanoregula sp. TaxID=2052170 RepID=UPI000CBB0A0C|nr:CBS domain-containing protein [Methanoregula sp.]PKG33393.1 MAG: histidine kinase [Methanoregula sp.]